MAFAAPLAASGAEVVAGGAVAAEGGAAGGAAAGTGARAAGARGGGAGAARKGKAAVPAALWADPSKPKTRRQRAETLWEHADYADLDDAAREERVREVLDDEDRQAAEDERQAGSGSPTEALARASKRVQPGQQVAGGLLAALVVYPVLLNFLKGGTPGVKQWARAKFFNGAQPGQTTSVNPSTPRHDKSGKDGVGTSGASATGPPAGGATTSGAAATAIAFARAQIGDPYQWGGNGPDRWDCSGLTTAAYAAAGIRLPRVTGLQILTGKAVSRANLQPGDLVFPDPGHVGIYTGGGMFVEAPRTGLKVREVPVWGFLTARRVTGA